MNGRELLLLSAGGRQPGEAARAGGNSRAAEELELRLRQAVEQRQVSMLQLDLEEARGRVEDLEERLGEASKRAAGAKGPGLENPDTAR